MQIIDAQVHIWKAPSDERPWIPGGIDYAHFGGEPFSASDVLAEMDRAGVERTLLVSPSWEGYRNDAVLEAATEHSDRFGAIVRVDLRERDLDQLVAWKADPRVLGARILFAMHTESWLRDGLADWFWPVAEEIGLNIMVFAPYQYAGIRAIAERYPKLRLALCHLSMDIALRDDEIAPQVDQVLTLAELPNIAVKASSLPSYVTDDYPFRSLHGHLERIVTAFGRERVFWGSDLSRLRCSYKELVDLFVKELTFLDDEDRTWIMGKAIVEWFGWDAAR